MAKYKVPTGIRFVKALQKNGYKLIRQKGSHAIMQSRVNKIEIFSVPNVKYDLDIGLLEDIRKNNLKVSLQKFIEILKDC
ncbi:MAG: type II toxin-antitoxin system HicA family toxin [Actinobacteria bacterium]|nr:type II toxin-antitoxin system HicA family toxin [Actinomycetota bacterium]